jgi:adenylate cyclase
MGIDEEGTLARLKLLRRKVFDLKIQEHQGHIVKTVGDGILIEFPSVVEAVQCAVEVQQRIAEHNAELPREQRLEFRAGINLGDVIIEDSDIYGDGVNVAARLESLAEPGGVCVSATVYEHVRDNFRTGSLTSATNESRTLLGRSTSTLLTLTPLRARPHLQLTADRV